MMNKQTVSLIISLCLSNIAVAQTLYSNNQNIVQQSNNNNYSTQSFQKTALNENTVDIKDVKLNKFIKKNDINFESEKKQIKENDIPLTFNAFDKTESLDIGKNDTNINNSFKNTDLENENTHAEKSIVQKYITNKYNLNNSEANNIVNATFSMSDKYNIDRYLLLGLIEHESSFNKNARSSANAIGLTQVVPRWHQSKIKKVSEKNNEKLNSVNTNIEVGTMILKEQLGKYSNVNRALQAYNGNHTGSSYSKKVMSNKSNIKNYVKKGLINM